MTFDELFALLPIPGEFDSMDACDQGRWREVVRTAVELAHSECVRLCENEVGALRRSLMVAQATGAQGCLNALLEWLPNPHPQNAPAPGRVLSTPTPAQSALPADD